MSPTLDPETYGPAFCTTRRVARNCFSLAFAERSRGAFVQSTARNFSRRRRTQNVYIYVETRRCWRRDQNIASEDLRPCLRNSSASFCMIGSCYCIKSGASSIKMSEAFKQKFHTFMNFTRMPRNRFDTSPNTLFLPQKR